MVSRSLEEDKARIKLGLDGIQKVRKDNLRKFLKEYKNRTALANRLGFTKGFITNLIGINPRATIGEKLARKIEIRLGLPAGRLDFPI